MKRSKEKQTGVAIIMVLLIVALATSLAVFITTRQGLWLHQLESQMILSVCPALWGLHLPVKIT
jgi:type II secretory pathway component PulK